MVGVCSAYCRSMIRLAIAMPNAISGFCFVIAISVRTSSRVIAANIASCVI